MSVERRDLPAARDATDPPFDPKNGADGEARPQAADVGLPMPHVRRRRWTRWLIWVVPLIALVALGFYIRRYAADRGPEVVLRFADGLMLEPGETPIRCRGVDIGRVVNVVLAGDQTGVDVTVRLRRDAESFARQGAAFWVVKPELRGGSLQGLGTVLTGPYLEARSGAGETQKQFVGLAKPPTASLRGLSIQLLGTQLKRVDRGTPVFYRGIPVGAVESASLSEDAQQVVLRATIETRYAALVRANSRFWSEAPAEVKGSIFSGVQVELDSIQRLLSGSIHFASPDEPLERPAMGDDRFVLHDEPREEWRAWSPKITIEPGPNSDGGETPVPPKPAMPSR